MEKREKIRELQEDLRRLDADIRTLDAALQRQIAARNGLSAYLEYLQESDKGSSRELPFPEFRIPISHHTTPAPRPYGYERPTAPNGHATKINVAREVREAVGEIEGEFTQKHITQKLSEKYPYASVRPAVVANALAKMVQREQGIVVWMHGSGSDPNVYRKVEDVPPLPQRQPSQEVDADGDGSSESNDVEDSPVSG